VKTQAIPFLGTTRLLSRSDCVRQRRFFTLSWQFHNIKTCGNH
jgi:hypothetical protein